MSSTRTKAGDDQTFHQHKFASSPEFERGLLANLVAKRCALIESRADRELIWFIQYLSHQDGGLAAVQRDLLAHYTDRIGTRTMLEVSSADSKNYTAEEVQKIRRELPRGHAIDFPLKGETATSLRATMRGIPEEVRFERLAEKERARLNQLVDDAMAVDDSTERERECQSEHDEAQKNPSSYPVSKLRQFCMQAATEGLKGWHSYRDEDTKNIEHEMAVMCLDPEWSFAVGGPWYFPRLVETLRHYQAEFIKRKSAGLVITTLGKKVCDELDYTSSSRCLTLMEGEARTGKSFSARAWCDLHPGQARFVEVPPDNEETGFFRALARGLGAGNFINAKASELRERVKSVLLSGDILLVLDEAHRLWPRANARYGFPKRIEWVMAMVNAGVPIAMISTPQFIQTQKAVEEKTSWNGAQLTGRLSNYVPLPAELTVEDLKAVAKSVLPEADAEVLKALANYARLSARYLAAIDSISKRGQWIAEKDGRKNVTTADVRKAMQESVIPADTKLKVALAKGRKPVPAHVAIQAPVAPAEIESVTPRSHLTARATATAATAPALPPQRANITELVTD